MAGKGLSNEEEAKSTIERLARKYLVSTCTGLYLMLWPCLYIQHKSTREKRCEVDIVRVEEDEELQKRRSTVVETTGTSSSAFDFTAPPSGGKENSEDLRDSIFRQPSAKRLETMSTSPSRCKPRTKLTSRQGSRSKCTDSTPPNRLVGVRRSLSNPEFKVPKPPMGHSTPGTVEKTKRRNSYFGFADLESPIKLSPVKGSSFAERLPSKSPTPEEQTNKPYKRVVGTYDIPLRRPTPRQARRRQQKQSPVCLCI